MHRENSMTDSTEVHEVPIDRLHELLSSLKPFLATHFLNLLPNLSRQ